jgi:hypothetical protein
MVNKCVALDKKGTHREHDFRLRAIYLRQRMHNLFYGYPLREGRGVRGRPAARSWPGQKETDAAPAWRFTVITTPPASVLYDAQHQASPGSALHGTSSPIYPVKDTSPLNKLGNPHPTSSGTRQVPRPNRCRCGSTCEHPLTYLRGVLRSRCCSSPSSSSSVSESGWQ